LEGRGFGAAAQERSREACDSGPAEERDGVINKEHIGACVFGQLQHRRREPAFRDAIGKNDRSKKEEMIECNHNIRPAPFFCWMRFTTYFDHVHAKIEYYSTLLRMKNEGSKKYSQATCSMLIRSIVLDERLDSNCIYHHYYLLE
jgi:hypothetical protein